MREIVELAKPKGIQVFVDGAHAFAHFPFTRDDLGADYYGTSLHKWLHAPIGTGFLYVRRDKIKKTVAAHGRRRSSRKTTFGSTKRSARTRRRITTQSRWRSRSIAASGRIERSRACAILRDRWANRLLAASDRVKMITPIGPNASGAIGVFSVEGMDMAKLGGWLLSKHNIVTTPMVNDEFQGMRITPNVYTTRGRDRSVRRPCDLGDKDRGSLGHRDDRA